jgi:hypothetical protein
MTTQKQAQALMNVKAVRVLTGLKYLIDVAQSLL